MSFSVLAPSFYVINKGDMVNGQQQYFCNTKPNNKNFRLLVPKQATDKFEKEYTLLTQAHINYNNDRDNNKGKFVLKNLISYAVGGLVAYSPFKYLKTGNKAIKILLTIPAFIVGASFTEGLINAMLPCYKSELNYQKQAKCFENIVKRYKADSYQ